MLRSHCQVAMCTAHHQWLVEDGPLQDPHPVLQLLLAVDTAAVVAMFDALPLLAEGVYCGEDDLAAQV